MKFRSSVVLRRVEIRAFASLVEKWRRIAEQHGGDPFREKKKTTRKQLERTLLEGDSDAAGIVQAALDDFSDSAAYPASPWIFAGYDGILAVDIGGTNIRTGVVGFRSSRKKRVPNAKVVKSSIREHAKDEPERDEAIERLRSAGRSRRQKADPCRSSMSMLTFYINRAGSNLGKQHCRVLERARDELRHQFGRG